MNKIDRVFRELGELYEFQKELSKFRIQKKEKKPAKGVPREDGAVRSREQKQ